MGLKRVAFQGITFAGIDMLLGRGLTFVSTIVLARILGPEQFGLIGMILVFITLGTVLVDSGFSSSLIRSNNSDAEDYSTVFYTNLASSILLYLIFFVLAPLIAQFYKQPVLTMVIRIYCTSFIITAFSSVQTAVLVKNLEFRKIMMMNIPSNLVGVSIGFLFAFNNMGVWSIVAMILSTQICYACIAWCVSKWKLELLFSFEKLKKHYNFGYKLMLSAILNTIFDNAYGILIGKFYALKTIGYYERAKTFNEYPVTMMSGVLNKVFYPMLSKIQDDRQRVSEVFRQLIQLSFFITAPIMLCVAAVAKPLFLLVLGPSWLSAVPYFQILCFSSILYPIHSFNINILQVFGRSDLFLKLEVVKKILTVIVIISTIRFGIYPLLIGSVIASYAAIIINGYYSEKMMNYPLKVQIFDLFPILITSCVSAFAVSFLYRQFNGLPVVFQIIFPFALGILIFFLVNYFLRTSSLKYFSKFINSLTAR